MSEKLSYSNFLDKNEFSYNINDGKIVFNTLKSKVNKSDKYRFWKIYCILKNNNTEFEINNELIDINKFKEFNILYTNLNVYIHTEYGVINGKITKTEPTIISTGKNINKKNETTILTQSLIHMRNLYLKKKKSGYYDKINTISDLNIYPMALQVYNKHKKNLIYPCYIQPKLDGIRLFSKYNTSDGEIELLSRRLNIYTGFDFIKNEIEILLKDNHDLILDGELYNHDLNLQNISGIVRNEKNNDNKEKLQYYIFDAFIQNNNQSFCDRFELLRLKFNTYTDFKYLILVDTTLVNNEKESDLLYKHYITDKYEGIVYKNKDAIYEYSTIKEIRSMQYLKRKKTYDAEYPIIGYEEGINGKDKGAIIFIMETEDKNQFKAVPNMPLKKRKELFIQAKKDFNRFKNKLATISFDEYSEDKIPLRPKFITIRDYE